MSKEKEQYEYRYLKWCDMGSTDRVYMVHKVYQAMRLAEKLGYHKLREILTMAYDHVISLPPEKKG